MIPEDYWQTLGEPDYLNFEVPREAKFILDEMIETIYPDYQNRTLRDFFDFLSLSREYIAEWNVTEAAELNEIKSGAEPTWFLRALVLCFGEKEAGCTAAAHPNSPQDWTLWFAQRAREQRRLKFPMSPYQFDIMSDILVNPYTTGVVLHEIALYYIENRNDLIGYHWGDFLAHANVQPETVTAIVNHIIDEESVLYSPEFLGDNFYTPNITHGPNIINHPKLTESTFLAYLQHNIRFTDMFSRDLGYSEKEYLATMIAFSSLEMQYSHLVPDEARSALVVKAAYV